MFSLGWKPSGRVSSEVALLVGLALADALGKSGIEGLGLKWPNDVLLHGRKVAGILVESRSLGGESEIIMGMGLNIAHREQDLGGVDRPWTDLAQQGSGEVNRQELLLTVLGELGARLAQLEAQGFEPIRRDWIAYHVFEGEWMTYQYQGKVQAGRVRGLSEEGALLLETGGEVVAVSSGEVSSLRADR